MRRVVMLSSGAGSWAAAKRVAERHGTDGLTLLFADTLIEDEDNYRFLIEASADVFGVTGLPEWLLRPDLPPIDDLLARRSLLLALAEYAMDAIPGLEWIVERRDPWQVFKDVRFLGNTRVDPCSRILKRELLRKWLDDTHEPDATVVYLGFDWSEIHRMERAAKHWEPWAVEAPMCERPYMSKRDALAWLRSEGIEPPRLYAAGFQHANCGGFCVKGGQAHFATLLRFDRDRYLYHEQKEEELREYLGSDVAIMRDRTGGDVKPLTMREFRERQEQQLGFDEMDFGSCSCFSPGEDAA